MKEYLKEYQNIAYSTLLNCKRNKKIPQAILLNGYKDTPLLEIAKYVSKVIVCTQEEPCEECLDCIRIDSENYTDLIIADGTNQTIKKGQIEEIQERFSMSALESKGIKIYIINKIENATTEAVNSLLKFLEEPTSDIYAIITTSNINNVLPTIISRCMNIRLKKASKHKLVVDATKKDIPLEDALILSCFLGSVDAIEDTYENSSYLSLKDIVIEFLNQINDEEDLLYFTQVEVSDIIKDKNDFLMFLELLEISFLDIMNYKNGIDLNYKEQEELISSLSNRLDKIEDKLSTIMLFKGCANLNANVKLLLDSLIIKLERR